MLHKSVLATLVFLFTGTVFAYPAVGDRVEWTGTIDKLDGTSTPIKVVKEILSQNSDSKKWTVKKDVTLGDERMTETTEQEAIYSPEQFKKTLETCEASGGKIEETTVPAGTYKTCMLITVSEDGRVDQKWWGDVPFGVVRKNTSENKNANNAKLDLNSILNGL